MSDTPQPVLVYTRIESNRRTTRLLLVSFAVTFLPVVSGGAAYVMPWIVLIGLMVAYQIDGGAWLNARLGPLLAEVDARRNEAGAIDLRDLPASALLLEGSVLALALVAVVFAFVAVTVFVISRYGARAVLRVARARPVGPDREPDLVRVVENLCIGAGLPLPSIHLVESRAPNAFATGRDPQHASLVVTRGLLTLLDRRELEGVIAHELSHIGNHDIRLSTTLAALVGTLHLPFRIAAAPFRFAFKLPWGFRIFALFVALPFFSLVISGYWFGLKEFSQEGALEEFPPFLWWWGLHAMLAPLYIVFVAPLVALLIRQAVSRQREFLADADAALLTRDPEGLALALVKVAAARGERLRVGEGSVHLYFADPREESGSLIHRLFPSHPPVEQRIELLARMGSGITPSDLQSARNSRSAALQTGSSDVAPK